MKKILILALALLFCILSIALISCEDEENDTDSTENQGLVFALNDDKKSFSVSGIGTCTDKKISIPSTHKGLPVTSIQDYAFSDCDFIEEIIIPDSVTTINNAVFYKSSSIKSITLGSNVSIIGGGAFSECISLENVYYDGTLEDWCKITFLSDRSNPLYYAKNFYINNVATTEISIPKTITSIKQHLFNGFEGITKLTIHNDVTSIGWCSINGCTSLTSIVIPSSVTSIGSSAFYGCDSLTIYCEASSKPSDWSSSWNSSRPVYWYSESEPTASGNYWHYGDNGEIVVWAQN